MDITSNQDSAQAAEILETLQHIQNTPELKAEASVNPEGVLRRFNLSAVARQAVALAIAGALVAPSAHVIKAENFW